MRAINDLVFLKNHLSALLVHFLSISLIRFEGFLTLGPVSVLASGDLGGKLLQESRNAIKL